MKRPVAALYVNKSSVYAELLGKAACFDETRDARLYDGNDPVVCHPPCAPWGVMSHLAYTDIARKSCGRMAVWQVRACGGVLEHPAKSKLWRAGNLPLPGEGSDKHGGYTLAIDQFDFGHISRKLTWLYIVGVDKDDLPPMPQPRADGDPPPKLEGNPRGKWIDWMRETASRPNLPLRVMAKPYQYKAAGFRRIESQHWRTATPTALALWMIETARRSQNPPKTASYKAK